MNRVFTMDQWWSNAHSTFVGNTDSTSTETWIESCKGYVELSGGGTAINRYSYNTDATYYKPISYLDGSYYRSSVLQCGGYSRFSALGLAKLWENGVIDGFEHHMTYTAANLAYNAAQYYQDLQFTCGGNTYGVQFSNDQGLALTRNGTRISWDSRSSSLNLSSQGSYQMRIRVLIDASSQVNIKCYCEYTGAIFAYYTDTTPITMTGFSGVWFANYGGSFANHTLYSVLRAERAGFMAAWTTNDLASFSYCLPMIYDMGTTSGGTGWESSVGGSVHTVLVDGDLTTYASDPDNLKNPIGFTASSSLGTIAAKCRISIGTTVSSLPSVGDIKEILASSYKVIAGVTTSVDFKIDASSATKKTLTVPASLTGNSLTAAFPEADMATLSITTASTPTVTIQNS